MADRDREQVRREIEDTKASMSAKIEELSDRVASARGRVENAREQVKSVREQVSLQRQVDERPWAVMGVSVAIGFLFQRLMNRRRYHRIAPLVIEDVREMALSTAEYVSNAVRAAADSAARLVAEGVPPGEIAGAEAYAARSRTALPKKKGLAAWGLIDIATKAIMTGLLRSAVSALTHRIHHVDGRPGIHEAELPVPAPGVGVGVSEVSGIRDDAPRPDYPPGVGAALGRSTSG